MVINEDVQSAFERVMSASTGQCMVQVLGVCTLPVDSRTPFSHAFSKLFQLFSALQSC